VSVEVPILMLELAKRFDEVNELIPDVILAEEFKINALFACAIPVVIEVRYDACVVPNNVPPTDIPPKVDIELDSVELNEIVDVTDESVKALVNVMLLNPIIFLDESTITAFDAKTIPGVIPSINPKFLPDVIDKYNPSASCFVKYILP
jgi:hypothetical protein